MNLKKRIKRALAGFLREELREYTDYSPLMFGPLEQEIIYDEIRFDTYKMEKLIDVDQMRYPYGLNNQALEEEGPVSYQIERAKRQFAEQVVEHIHVDYKQLMDPVYIGKAAIRLTLRVQVPRK